MYRSSMEGQRRDHRTYALIGAAFEVHGHLGPGFLERIYAEAFKVELARVGIDHRSEVTFPARYKGQVLPVTYRADLVCFDGVLVELKAQRCLTPVDHAQVINYLKLSGLPVGLLLNFGRPSLEYQRFIHTPPTTPSA